MTSLNKTVLFLFVLLSITSACYTLKEPGSLGAAESVQVDFFPNQASLVNPNLSQNLTDRLRDKFQRETRLTLVNKEGQLKMSGVITDYRVDPVAVQNNQSGGSLTRLSITIQVKYENTLEPKRSFDQSFSAFADFSANQTLNQVEATVSEEALTRLIQDVFNKAVIDW